MIVMKFGGTSVQDAACMRQVVELVTAARARKPLVVLSAMGGATDRLFQATRAAACGDEQQAQQLSRQVFDRAANAAQELLHHIPDALRTAIAAMQDEVQVLLRGVQLLREASARTTDAIVAHGERLATAVFTAALQQRGVPCIEVDARTVLRTDDRFGKAQPLRDAIQALANAGLRPHLQDGFVVVTQGYIGSTERAFTTTLGRGGSDYTASLLGAALVVDEVQIWTDVNGVMTADPRVVPDAHPIPVMHFAEAAELAAFGAKVLHPATIQPAIEAGIPVTVRHTMRPQGPFTTITADIGRDGRDGPQQGVTAFASRGPVTVLTMTSTRMLDQSGFLARLFAVFGELDVSVDLVVTAEVSVACTIEPDAPLAALTRALEGIASVSVATDRAIVAAVGRGLRATPGVTERALAALGDITPELIALGGNDINLSLVVPAGQASTAVRRLHAAFFATVPA